VPAAALAGATFVVVAAIISLVALAPTPVPLGIVTSVIGAPLFIHLLRRSRRQYRV
jgi:iron complex transport system permease protein